jgi:ATP-dependent Lon protease
MTGEITLRGRILPIGGLTEKLLAARRVDVKTVIIPQDNVKDLSDIPDRVKEGLEIVPVSSLLEAVPHIFRQKDQNDGQEAPKKPATQAGKTTTTRGTTKPTGSASKNRRKKA